MDRLLEAMIKAAREGGEVALGHYRRGVAIALKDDRSPVTGADRDTEQAIVAVLRGAFPDLGVLGEELGAQGPTRARFIVDPIDGTRNFVRRIPLWAVLIALEEDGRITAGVVYQPVSGDLHLARAGRGALLNGEPIAVSAVARLGEAALAHNTLNTLRRSAYWEGFVRLVDATDRQRGFGDFLCYTLLAEGKVDVAAGANVKPWDLAAVKILVEEAGGAFTDLDGRPSLHSGTVLATNGRLHAEALGVLRGDGAK